MSHNRKPLFLSPADPRARTDPAVFGQLPEAYHDFVAETGDAIERNHRRLQEHMLYLHRHARKPASLITHFYDPPDDLLLVTLYPDHDAYRQLKALARSGLSIIPFRWQLVALKDCRVRDYFAPEELRRFLLDFSPQLDTGIIDALMPLNPAVAVYRIIKEFKGHPELKTLRFLLLGRLYGIPKCCTCYFTALQTGRCKPHPLQQFAESLHRPFNAQPYIRCYACARELLDASS